MFSMRDLYTLHAVLALHRECEDKVEGRDMTKLELFRVHDVIRGYLAENGQFVKIADFVPSGALANAKQI